MFYNRHMSCCTWSSSPWSCVFLYTIPFQCRTWLSGFKKIKTIGWDPPTQEIWVSIFYFSLHILITKLTFVKAFVLHHHEIKYTGWTAETDFGQGRTQICGWTSGILHANISCLTAPIIKKKRQRFLVLGSSDDKVGIMFIFIMWWIIAANLIKT